jgi:hypothetical protein
MQSHRNRTVAAVFALALLALSGTAFAQQAPGHLMVAPDNVEWGPVGSLPPGAQLAVLEGDPSQEGAFTMRLHLPANYDIPVHTHPAVERVTVLSGTFYAGIGDTFDRDAAHALGPGGLAVMEIGLPMYAYTGDEPVVIQLNGVGPWGIEYVNPADDPRKQQGD